MRKITALILVLLLILAPCAVEGSALETKLVGDAVCRLTEKDDDPSPSITIINGLSLEGKTFPYRSSFTFISLTGNAPDGCGYMWLVDGEVTGSGGRTCEIKQAKKDFVIRSVLLGPDGESVAVSSPIHIAINTSFFSRFVSFFRMIFGTLPSYS